MSYKKIPIFEKYTLHAVLVLGSLVFSFPFLWMVGTSAKVPREMATESLRVMPTTPHPQFDSPHIDPDQYKPVTRPDGIPPDVWASVQPQMTEMLKKILQRWKPELPGTNPDSPPLVINDYEAYEAEMIEGLYDKLGKRLSDESRHTALATEKLMRQDEGQEIPSDNVLMDALRPEAIVAGVGALLDDATRLIDEQMLRDTFDQCYRRFCLSEVRIRTRDYKLYSLYTGGEWRRLSGPAELVGRTEVSGKLQEVRLGFTPDEKQTQFLFSKDLSTVMTDDGPMTPEDIDRIYVRYRGDSSWARLNFHVILDGRLYGVQEYGYLFERDWFEQEFRWPAGAGDITERRIYQILEDQGPAPENSPMFGMMIDVRKNSQLGAWKAKLLRNYRQVFREVPFARYIMTSFSLAILNILLSIFACTLVAYSFARLQWPGRDLCFGILLATMMIPPQVTMIPGFLIIKEIGWYNSLLPLWVPAAFGTPFFIFLLRQFFKNIPADLEDAAHIDGCGFLRIYWHVMLPLVKPTIATIAIFTFMGTWNNFMGPLIFVNDERLFPLALGLFKFNLRSGGDVGLMMAGSFMMTMPIIILFFFLQRYFIQGISLTGTKG